MIEKRNFRINMTLLIILCILSFIVVKVNYTVEQETTIEIEVKVDGLKGHFEKIQEMYAISSLEITFNKKDITELSNISLKELNNRLKNTGFEGLAYMFIKAEKEFKVNSLFLVGLAANESAWGKSRLAQEKNNLTGFRAYNHDPYNSATHFKSWEDCILQTAEYIRNNYLEEDGPYYNGVAVIDLNKRYAINDNGFPNFTWSNTIINIANKLKEG